jgi:hypothetical protein
MNDLTEELISITSFKREEIIEAIHGLKDPIIGNRQPLKEFVTIKPD